MRIDGTPGAPNGVGPNPAGLGRSGTADDVAADPSAPAARTVAAEQFQPSSDFQPLAGALARIPLVRQEVVGEVAARLSGGELQTPQARRQTVESLLGVAPRHD